MQLSAIFSMLQQYLPFTVLKPSYLSRLDATGLKLQQYLPFTVLKPSFYFYSFNFFKALQQYLPFTVLKHINSFWHIRTIRLNGCNSTYRLRYWNQITRLHNEESLHYVATVLTVYGIETKAPSDGIFVKSLKVATVLTVYGIETV